MICCHNSAARLPVTLAHLGAQKVSGNVPWEVILVDNASSDGTVEVARQAWEKHPAAPLHVIAEPRPGLAFARRRGVAEAQYEFISFVDDDNWVEEGWIERTATLLDDHPEVGALGGSSTAVFEETPPDWFFACKTLYAVSSENWPAGECPPTRTVWGAGMAIRKAAWQDIESLDSAPLAIGRCGKTLGAGDDTELCYRLRLAGWKLWYEPQLRLQHYMPQGRLDWAYSRRLHRGSGASAVALSAYESILWPRNRAFPKLRQSWEWKILRTIRNLLARPGKLVKAVFTLAEGDLEILQIEDSYGRLIALARNRSSYYANLAQVRELAKHLQSRRQADCELTLQS